MAEPLIALGRLSRAGSPWRAAARTRRASPATPTRAEPQQIADNLIQDWDVARRLVESYGGKFIGILQPVAYYSNTKLGPHPLSDLREGNSRRSIR